MPNSDAELLDVLTEDGHPTGTTKTRSQVHIDGDWHRAIHIWVVRGKNLVLLQRRALTKDLEPGKLDVSVGGHYRAGEIFIDAIREAEEELGITFRPGQLEYLHTVTSVREYPDLDPPRLDREFQEVYVGRDDRPLDEFRLPPDEVDTVYEVPVAAAIELFQDGQYTAAAGFDAQGRPSNAVLHVDDLPNQGRELHVGALQKVLALHAASEV